MVVGTGVLTQIPHSSISTTITNPTQDGLPRSKVMEDGPSVQIMENIFQDAMDALQPDAELLIWPLCMSLIPATHGHNGLFNTDHKILYIFIIFLYILSKTMNLNKAAFLLVLIVSFITITIC